MVKCPQVQESHHGAFPSAQVQAIVPIGPKATGYAVSAKLAVSEVQDFLHVFIHRILAAVCVRDHLMEKIDVPRFPYIFAYGRNQP